MKSSLFALPHLLPTPNKPRTQLRSSSPKYQTSFRGWRLSFSPVVHLGHRALIPAMLPLEDAIDIIAACLPKLAILSIFLVISSLHGSAHLPDTTVSPFYLDHISTMCSEWERLFDWHFRRKKRVFWLSNLSAEVSLVDDMFHAHVFTSGSTSDNKVDESSIIMCECLLCLHDDALGGWRRCDKGA